MAQQSLLVLSDFKNFSFNLIQSSKSFVRSEVLLKTPSLQICWSVQCIISFLERERKKNSFVNIFEVTVLRSLKFFEAFYWRKYFSTMTGEELFSSWEPFSLYCRWKEFPYLRFNSLPGEELSYFGAEKRNVLKVFVLNVGCIFSPSRLRSVWRLLKLFPALREMRSFSTWMSLQCLPETPVHRRFRVI